jgi:anthranilate phosphoribosyltransferase
VIQRAITRLLEGHDLTRAEARDVMGSIMDGEATQAQMGGFLIALRFKGETAQEIAGCAEAMREHVLAVNPKRDDLVDTAGTGGDNAHTLNISTAAALVAAAAGAAVAKHGNRAVSSSSGSADVLEALGFSLELPPERIERSIDELGFGFLFAPAHHPAMRHAAPVRRELATRTVFNVLGPLTNPAGARAQVVGVFSADLVPTIAEVLTQLGSRRAFVVHGAHGIDELSPAGPNLVAEVARGQVVERTIDPLELGVARCAPDELRGGTPAENAAAIRRVFDGADGGARDAILLNAGGAIAAAGHAADLREGLELARKAVASGAAGERLEALVAFSQAHQRADAPGRGARGNREVPPCATPRVPRGVAEENESNGTL